MTSIREAIVIIIIQFTNFLITVTMIITIAIIVMSAVTAKVVGAMAFKWLKSKVFTKIRFTELFILLNLKIH